MNHMDIPASTIVPPSLIAEGNCALRDKKYESAIRLYIQALLTTPALAKTIGANIELARARYQRERGSQSRKRVAVCGWDLAHNAAGRVYTLAKLYETFADVEIIGAIFPKYGREVWEPIRNTTLPCHTFVVEDQSRFIEQAIGLVTAHPYDMVHLSKPRAPNVFFGILYKLIWGATVLVDVDDEELGFVGAELPINLGDYLKEQESLPGLQNLIGKEWTQIAVGLANKFDDITVSNSVLQQRYGGEIICHARDEKHFVRSLELQHKSREKFGIPTGDKVVLFFGTPRQHKGLLEAANAIASLKRNDILFVIVGDFNDAELKEKLKAINGCRLKFIGNQSFDAAPEIVSVADLSLLLQDRSSFAASFQTPAKLSDCLAMGVPVIATRTPAIASFIDAGAVIEASTEKLPRQISSLLFDNLIGSNSLGREFFDRELSLSVNSVKLERITALQAKETPNSSPDSAWFNCFGKLDSTLRSLLQNLMAESTGAPRSSTISTQRLATIDANLPSHDVIICIHNAPDDVKRCLDSVLKHRQGVDRAILIDDCSEKETVDLLEGYVASFPAFFIKRRTSERSGYTKAANLGLQLSSAHVRTLLNSDTIVTSGWAKKILAHFVAYPELGILGPLSNAASHQSVPDTKGTATQTAINSLPEGVLAEEISQFCEATTSVTDMPYVPLVHGFCFSISSECLNSINFLDEQSFPRGYGEETDLCIRAHDAGFALGIALNTFIFHAKSKSYQSEERVALMNAGWDALVKKHGKRRLTHSIKVMEEQPRLAKMRKLVWEQFYDPMSSIHSNENKARPRGELVDGSPNTKAIAFYLPQFHPIPENDSNWGKGFTEWTNVVKARPRFPDHYQPRLPGELGFYDLRLPEIMSEQSRIAMEHGLSGFCFYYYRFGSKRVLEAPLESYLRNASAALPFCYCWANESWTRAWDGKTSDVLLTQQYDENTLDGFVEDVSLAISDDRYIRMNGRPLVLIYQFAEIPNASAFAASLRAKLKASTGMNPLVGTVFSPAFETSQLQFLDFVVQFPPHRIPRSGPRVTIRREAMAPFEPEREDYYESYDEVIKAATNGANLIGPMFPGTCPDWDNSARRQKNATTLVGSTPKKFSNWVEAAGQIAVEKYSDGKIPAPVIFVNAWNEWAEGAVLEPSERYGRDYLRALQMGLLTHRHDLALSKL